MGLLMVILLISFCVSLGPKTASANTFDVTSYGAVGDGDTDDTHLLGDISAPKTKEGWEGCDTNGYLMHFTSVSGLVMDGSGQLDGQGSIWWREGEKYKPNGPPCHCPSMLRFDKCDGLQLRGTRHINGPKSHISITHCDGADIGNIYISAPEHSPNTDGIDISWSSHVNIHDSAIESGDDCIAINGGTYDLNVTGITCGPGHGISIGSLGKNGAHSTVKQVLVQNCNITGTQNGLRIKTSPHGSGYAQSIVFEDINLINVKNPILIDQHYCTKDKNYNCPAPPSASAVKVSDVRYQNIHGSSASKQAITINCAARWNCTEIVMNDVGITGEGVFAHCENASGDFGDTTPEVNCSPAVRTFK
ncbi:hypothetical protein QVD17_11830 [Tagetes erecta]|uniref:Polygalacturonase n=1 Tax=Tagetes erecta TaxID=13708 RepID=A0AAD8P2J2_TARER|nr:hypothetical protein QVD17_11830 [Tagetes erecta]